jgi:hypothetical protein
LDFVTHFTWHLNDGHLDGVMMFDSGASLNSISSLGQK